MPCATAPRSLVAALMLALCGLVSSSALAWEAVEGPTLQVPKRPHAMQAVQIKGSTALIATSPKGTWVVQPRTGQVLFSSSTGGTSMMVRGVNSEGYPTVLTCGPFGIHSLSLGPDGFGDAVQLSDQACGRIAPLVARGGASDADLATAGQGASAWIFKGDKLELVGSVSGLGDDVPMLVSGGDRIAAAGKGRTYVLRVSAAGGEPVKASAPIAGLGRLDGHVAWSIPSKNTVEDDEGRVISVAEGPADLYSGDLDGDGRSDLVVSHPEEGRFGVILAETGQEQIVRMAVRMTAVTVADLDEDGCGDIAVAGPGGRIYVVRGRCGDEQPVAEVAEPEDEPYEGPTRFVLDTTWKPLHVSPGHSVQVQLVDPQGATSFSASGGPPSLDVKGSGVLTYTAQAQDVGRWRVNVRLWDGQDWSRRAGLEIVVHRDPSTEPGASSGAVVPPPAAPAAAPPATVASNPRGQTVMGDQAFADPIDQPSSSSAVRGCAIGLGAAFGATDAQTSWALLGQSVYWSGSPAASFSCEGGKARSLWWFAGIDTAPIFVYLLNDFEMRHGLSSTVGVGYGSNGFKVGAYGTVGLIILGLGARFMMMPFKTRKGLRHGLDVRLTWFPAESFAGQAIAMYTVQLGKYRD